MAILFPSLDVIHRLKVPPTEGELYLCKFLKEKLDDSFSVFFNPYLDGDRPDIIVLKKGHGAVIVEIKDWNLDSYKIDEKNRWSVFETSKNRWPVIRSPHAQVFQYKKNLFDLHLPTLGQRESLNKNFFKVINCYVYFHLGTKKQIEEKYILPLDKTQLDVDNNTKRFLNKKIQYENYENKRQYLQNKKKQFERDKSLSITTDTVDNLAKRINKLEPTILFTDVIFDEFFRRLNPPEHVQNQGVKLNYDTKQRNLIESVGEFKKVKGVAGSGKTTIIAKRAANAFKRHSSPVLILTYNITLKHYIRDKISDVRENIEFNNFEISNYHTFFNSQLNNYNIDTNEFRESNEKIGSEEEYLRLFYKTDFFKGLKKKIEKYQTILVDEIQDYEPEWVKIIRANFLEDGGEMILFGEPSQNIYKREYIDINIPQTERASVIVQGFGSWQKLTKSYRSNIASPLINLFKEFQQEFLIEKYRDVEIFESEYKQGAIQFDVLKYQAGRDLGSKNIYNEIMDYIKVNEFIPNDTTILCSTFDGLRPLVSLFNNNEKTMSMCENDDEYNKIIKLCNDDILVKTDKARETCYKNRLDNFRRRKKNFFVQNSGLIKLSTPHSFKGLESPTVFYILQKHDDHELVYTAMTRAKKNLIIFDINSRYSSFFEKLLS